jgi:hypothetical protein
LSFSQKAIRHLQNQHAYQCRKAVIHASLRIPCLLAALIAVTESPLPTSTIFRQAALSADALDETDYDDLRLAHFDGCPPYGQRLDSTYILRDIDRLMDALHGRRQRQQREHEDKRLKRYKTLPLAVFQEEVHTEMMNYLREWKAIGLALDGLPLDEELDITLGQHSREWYARRCYSLYQDFRALRAGCDAFLCLYVNRWS